MTETPERELDEIESWIAQSTADRLNNPQCRYSHGVSLETLAVWLPILRSAFSGIPRTENEPCPDDPPCDACVERASVISSASPLSEDTKRLDFLQAWCNDMFWASERNPVGEPRLTLSWFIGHGRSPAFDTTGDDWRDAIDQARVKMGDIDRLSASAPSPEDKGSDNAKE